MITREMLEGALARSAGIIAQARAIADHDRASQAVLTVSWLTKGLASGWRSHGSEFFVRSFTSRGSELEDFDPFWARDWCDDVERASLAMEGLTGRLGMLGEAESRACEACGSPSVVIGTGGDGAYTTIMAACSSCLRRVVLAQTKRVGLLGTKRRTPRPLEQCVPEELSKALASPKARELLAGLASGWRGCAGPTYLLRAKGHPLGEVYWAAELADDPLVARAELGPPFESAAKQRLGSLAECDRRACGACRASAFVVGFDRDVYAYDPSVTMEEHTLCPACGHAALVHSDDGYQPRIAYE